MMEVRALGRRRGSGNTTQEFRGMVAQAKDPARPIADAARC